MGISGSKQFPPLETISTCQTSKFMGTWFVIGVKPTIFEKTCSNAVETYTRVTSSGRSTHDVDIDFQYNQSDAITSPLKSLPQRGWIQGSNKEVSGNWKVSPFGPIRMPYPIIELDEENYNYCVIGYSNRNYVWIMCRKPVMEEATYGMLKQRLVEKHQYSLDGLRKVPQVWTKDERRKRGLDGVIDDKFLVNGEE